jgi:hypothetical protein
MFYKTKIIFATNVSAHRHWLRKNYPNFCWPGAARAMALTVRFETVPSPQFWGRHQKL